MRFTKMHGAANDYVVVECFHQARPTDAEALARRLCDRRRGVGADGFVLVLPDDQAHAEMRMHNPDGSYSAMCGNALRCVAKMLRDSGIVSEDSMTLRSADRLVAIRMIENGDEESRVEADLGPPSFAPDAVPTTLPADDEGYVRNAPLELNGKSCPVTSLSMGNPHCVLFIDELGEPSLDRLDAQAIGGAVENHPAFPERTNVELLEVVDRGHLRQRTWERGAGETLACGSGACASAVASALLGRTDREVSIELRGGVLDVAWRESDGHVLMTGPAVKVFEGTLPA